MARRKRRRSAVGRVKRRRRRRTVYASNPVRRRRRKSVRRNPVSRRRKRRSYRRNPVGVSARGFLGNVVQGAKDATAVVVGRGVTNLVAQRIPFGQTSAIGQAAVRIIIGTLLAPLVGKITKSPRTASFFLAGAYSDVVAKALAPIPVIGPAVTGLGLYGRGVGVYPRAGGVGVYPRLNGWGSAPNGAPLQFSRQASNAGLDNGMSAAGQAHMAAIVR